MYKGIVSFESISVRNMRVGNGQVSAVYTIKDLKGKEKSFKIHYSYTPSIKIDYIVPFAGLIASAPLINYALFSEYLIFDVPLSQEETAFIEKISDTTAKDILVNKFIQNTGFIKEEIREELLKEIDSGKFSLGKFLFLYEKTEKYDFNVQNDRAMILSSGGKESLLSYGLLKEAGFTTYPAFFNESGMHWLTAITAYRIIKEKDKNTVKVWSDVDRLYNFFLRNFPFVKTNYWDINKDTYPVRLFIFGVYVFSFLPYILKEKIGNVLLGDEFDDPSNFINNANVVKGLTHYYGIYDQTAVFDQYMTNFFHSLDIPLKQWSIVRPLSGFMVEKILGEHFPDLFALQRSCHNVHIENNSILPCGKCKKCLGIELYLLANHLNAQRIGYKKEDIEKLQERLKAIHLRLDTKEFQHALYKATNGRKGKEWKEVESLQFNPVTSPISNFPISQRDKVFNVLFKYVPEAYSNGKFYNKKQFMEAICK